MSSKKAPPSNPAGTPIEGGLYHQCLVEQDPQSLPSASDPVLPIPPFHYCYVLDTNKNVTRLEVGPQRLTCQDNEKFVLGLTKMIVIPPMHYAIIENPVMRNNEGKVLVDKYGQVKLRHGEFETRFHITEPFPLFPGETLVNKVLPLRVVPSDHALRLRALRDFTDRFAVDAKGVAVRHIAGEEWLFFGPATYKPQVEIEVVEMIKAVVLLPDQAVMLRARRNCYDRFHDMERKAGETWLTQIVGTYMLGVDEELVKVVDSIVLNQKVALHLRANRTFTDIYGIARKAGEEWLITSEMAEKHLPDVNETVVNMVFLTVLSARDYCVIIDPWNVEEKKPMLGTKKVVAGPITFFLQPFESLENGVEPIFMLTAGDALFVKARERFHDGRRTRNPGCSWTVYGPQAYVPPAQVEVRSYHRSLLNLDSIGVHMLFWKSYHPGCAPRR